MSRAHIPRGCNHRARALPSPRVKIVYNGPRDAGVVELVDAPDSKSGSARSVGSIPTARTIPPHCQPAAVGKFHPRDTLTSRSAMHTAAPITDPAQTGNPSRRQAIIATDPASAAVA